MPSFVPILRRADLPPEGPRPRELYTRDFKRTMSPKNLEELAKDVAAFANALGGSLIIGTNEDGAESLSYPGLSVAAAEALVVALVAAQAYLSPRPIAEPQTIEVDGGQVVLVVNVWPYPDQPVGARLGDQGWRFPVRVGDHTRFLEPAMLPMLTNARVRRTVILLESIPVREQGRVVVVIWRNPTNRTPADPWRVTCRVDSIDPEHNSVFLTELDAKLAPVRPEGQPASIPLDDIEAVWEEERGSWDVRVAGHFAWPKYISNPSSYMGR